MTPDEARRFAAQPWAGDAVQVRRWDDAAKDPSAATPPPVVLTRVFRRALRAP